MNIIDKTVHHRQVFAHFDEKDLHRLLAQKLAEDAGFELRPETRVRVIISKVDSSTGHTSYAEVTLTNDLPLALSETL